MLFGSLVQVLQLHLNGRTIYQATFQGFKESAVRRGTTARACTSLLVAFLICVTSLPAQAVNRTWINPGSGNFNDPNNWFEPGIPTASDFVSFAVAGSPFTVTFPGNTAAIGGGAPVAHYASSYLWVRTNTVTLSGSTQATRGQSTYSVTNASQTEANRGTIIGVLAGDVATLNVSHNAFTGGGLTDLNAVAATLGDAAGSTGTLNMNFGAFHVTGSDFTQTTLIVGNNGTGALNVNSGSHVSVLGGNSRVTLGKGATGAGSLTINGAGSTLTVANQLWVGGSGDGDLTIQNGGLLVTQGVSGLESAIIGTFAGSDSILTINGEGSLWWNRNAIRVGNSGRGVLMISNGGDLYSEQVAHSPEIGTSGSGAAVVTGLGSTWTAPHTMYIGSTGTGTLSILDGGHVASDSALIRGLDSGSGQVFVSGAGSSWTINGGPLTIGLPELGFSTSPTLLNIDSGGAVDVVGDILLNDQGNLIFQGGTLSAGSISQQGGSFQWYDGVLHTSVFNGDLNNGGGMLAPGQSIGGTTIFGDYLQQSSAAMEIEITHPTFMGSDPERDFVFIDGVGTLGGDLQLVLTGNYVPTGDETFAIVSANSLTGELANVSNGQRLTTSNGSGSFIVNYGQSSPFNPNQIVLSAFEAAFLPGDYDQDGIVGGADLTVWQENYSVSSGPGLAADGNDDGLVNGADFLVWQRHFGHSITPDASVLNAASIPEPTGFTLVVTALGLLGMCKRLLLREMTL